MFEKAIMHELSCKGPATSASRQIFMMGEYSISSKPFLNVVDVLLTLTRTEGGWRTPQHLGEARAYVIEGNAFVE